MHQEIINWVNLTFTDRINKSLRIRVDGNRWVISVKEIDYIYININPNFYKILIPTKCDRISTENQSLSIFRFNEEKYYFKSENESFESNYDFIGSIFWYINRLEEYDNSALDIHDRFSYFNSIAYKFDIILCPIVDEYFSYLIFELKKVCKDLIIDSKEMKVLQTFDIDTPFLIVNKNIYRLFRHVLKSLAYLKIRYSINTLKIWFLYQIFKNDIKDPMFNFNKIFNTLKNYRQKCVFFLITNCSNKKRDGDSDFKKNNIKSLSNEIIKNGFNLGFHFSFDSYNDKKLLLNEITIGKQNNIYFNMISRQHYLRYDISKTPSFLNDLKIINDFTLGFPEHVGFRCGTSHPFRMFDYKNMKVLDIIQNPLIVMDVTLFGKNYMNLDFEKSNEIINILKREIKKHGGNFILLWHNDQLATAERYKFFENTVANFSEYNNLEIPK